MFYILYLLCLDASLISILFIFDMALNYKNVIINVYGVSLFF